MPTSSEDKTQQAQQALDSLRADIQAGLDSGPATPLDMEAIKVEGRRRLAGMNTAALFAERRDRADFDAFDQIMRREGGEAPLADDLIP